MRGLGTAGGGTSPFCIYLESSFVSSAVRHIAAAQRMLPATLPPRTRTASQQARGEQMDPFSAASSPAARSPGGSCWYSVLVERVTVRSQLRHETYNMLHGGTPAAHTAS